MSRRAVAFRGLALVCALVLVYSSVQALGLGPFEGLSGDPPDWIDGPLYWLLLANGFIALLVGRRGITPGVSVVLIGGGVTTILAGGILQAFEGGHFHVPPPVEVAYPGGFILAGIGIVQFDLADLREEGSGRAGVGIALGVGFGMLVAEAGFGAVSTTVWLLPLLWAKGNVGPTLVPHVILGGVRWLRRSGIRVDDRLGVRAREYTGLRWDWRAVIRLEENPQFLRAGCIVVATIGLIVVLLAPTVPHSPDSSLAAAHTQMICLDLSWANSLHYRADWSAMHLSWPNGCNGGWAFVNWRYAVFGGLLFLGGTAGERIRALRDH